MPRKLLGLLLTLMLLLPAVALGEATSLPYGLTLGTNETETESAFAANATLAASSWQKVDDGNGTVEYDFDNVALPDTDLTATGLYVQIDENNSQNEPRLTMISYNVSIKDSSIVTFRAALAAMTAELGDPDSDPFDESGIAQYVEWGTLGATWTRDDVRVSLDMSRMYEESVSVLYSSRINYDEADLAE